MKTNNKPTWLGYLNALKNKEFEAAQLKLTGFDDFFLANDFAQSFFMHSIPFIYLLDYQSNRSHSVFYVVACFYYWF